MRDDYFTQEQVNFMTGVTETLIACRWEDDEAFAIAPDVLTDWENANEHNFDFWTATPQQRRDWARETTKEIQNAKRSS